MDPEIVEVIETIQEHPGLNCNVQLPGRRKRNLVSSTGSHVQCKKGVLLGDMVAQGSLTGITVGFFCRVMSAHTDINQLH